MKSILFYIAFIFVVTLAINSTPMTHSQAEALLTENGITLSSTDGCSDKTNPKCTSLDGIHDFLIHEIIIFKEFSNCEIVVTGGTEVGHQSGVHSHGNGYKLDIRSTSCVSNFIRSNFTKGGIRMDGSYKDQLWLWEEEIYADETNRPKPHWDITRTRPFN